MNIGFIGAGNMGGALINGLLSTKKYNVFVYDLNKEKLKFFSDNGALLVDSIDELAKTSDLIILTVKPNIYPSVLTKLSELNYNKKLISVAPGLSLDYLSATLPKAQIIRTMPNTPAMVSEGMTLVVDIDNKEFLNEVVSLLECVGKVSVLPESLIDAGTALSGSSPAMVYRLIDAMANGAVAYGINKQEAIKIAAQAVLGSAKMVLESDIHPIQLSDAVCSPGGTTIEMVNELGKLGFGNTVISAMDRCIEKSLKMKK
ncbi:MAG: pyrroline-5-carboxylate reductase [Clostridia bacterium]|nr:pyrroline-5-carboxylate reductase [Clostridia bacterium]